MRAAVIRKYGVLLLLGGLLLPHGAWASGEGDISLLVLVFGAGAVVVLLALHALLMLLTAALVTSRAVALGLSVLYHVLLLPSLYWCFGSLFNPVFASRYWHAGDPWEPGVLKSAAAVALGIGGIALLSARIWSKRHQRRLRKQALAADLQIV